MVQSVQRGKMRGEKKFAKEFEIFLHLLGLMTPWHVKDVEMEGMATQEQHSAMEPNTKRKSPSKPIF